MSLTHTQTTLPQLDIKRIQTILYKTLFHAILDFVAYSWADSNDAEWLECNRKYTLATAFENYFKLIKLLIIIVGT